MSAVAKTKLDQLRQQLVGTQSQHADRSVLSTGFKSLDRLLPQSGIPTGSLIEWVSDAPGLRTTTIAVKCAAEFLRRPGAMAVVDPLNEFYPASLESFGVPLHRLMIVRPNQKKISSALSQSERSDSLWAIEQLARCSGVQILMTWIDRISSTAQRRLQLAVESSGVTVFMVRPPTALSQTSWADLRFHVQSDGDDVAGISKHATRSTVQLIRSKNAVQHRGFARLECLHETGVVSEISELAGAASAATFAG